MQINERTEQVLIIIYCTPLFKKIYIFFFYFFTVNFPGRS